MLTTCDPNREAAILLTTFETCLKPPVYGRNFLPAGLMIGRVARFVIPVRMWVAYPLHGPAGPRSVSTVFRAGARATIFDTKCNKMQLLKHFLSTFRWRWQPACGGLLTDPTKPTAIIATFALLLPFRSTAPPPHLPFMPRPSFFVLACFATSHAIHTCESIKALSEEDLSPARRAGGPNRSSAFGAGAKMGKVLLLLLRHCLTFAGSPTVLIYEAFCAAATLSDDALA